MFPGHISDIISITTLIVLVIMFITPIFVVIFFYFRNRNQTQHSLLRGKYWFVGILRYVIEKVGPEFRFYITDEDNTGKPISRVKFISIMKAAKYLKTLISYGSKRDFSAPGIYINNSMFPRLNSEMEVDNSIFIHTKRYDIEKETLFFRHERKEETEVRPWYLTDNNVVTVGVERDNPWKLKGLVGMSGMSYGALGPNAIRALSNGIAMAGGSWMNTGEGGISAHHLAGGCDLVFQIGPGLFGVRDKLGEIDWDLLRQKAAIPQVKAIELKLAQGAKVRGGHVEGMKVTKEIANIRGVEPWKNIDSPNRFHLFNDLSGMFDFIEKIQTQTGLPVGIKIVVGDENALNSFCEEYVKRGAGPDFISIDGGEGGTGATFKEMADSLGLPILSAIVIADDALRRHGIRHKIKLIASGQLHLPDEQAVALGLGADLIAVARSMMISVGCIMAEKCHSNDCPVGVATTDAKLQRLLFVNEKKYRVLNYLITIRAGLFSLSAACGLTSPTQFKRKHMVFKDEHYNTTNCATLYPYPD